MQCKVLLANINSGRMRDKKSFMIRQIAKTNIAPLQLTVHLLFRTNPAFGGVLSLCMSRPQHLSVNPHFSCLTIICFKRQREPLSIEYGSKRDGAVLIFLSYAWKKPAFHVFLRPKI
jgi:hypothetical protein